MVAGLGIPRVDPYSFTAPGHEWVVQSWLPEWTYGWAQRLGGFRLVVLEQALLIALLVWLVVRLVRAGRPCGPPSAGSSSSGSVAVLVAPTPALRGHLHGAHHHHRREPAQPVAARPRRVAVGQQPRLVPPRPGLAGGAGGGRGVRLAGLAPRRHALRGRVRGRAWSWPSSTPSGPSCWPSRSPWATSGRRSSGSSSGCRPTSSTRRPFRPHVPGAGPAAPGPGPAELARRGAGGRVPRRRPAGHAQPAHRRRRPRPGARAGCSSGPTRCPRCPPRPPAGSGSTGSSRWPSPPPSSSSGSRSRPTIRSTPSGYPVEATDFLEEHGPAGRAPPRRPPGLRRQLLRAPLRPQGQGLHRRPLRHVPGRRAPRLPAAARRAPPVAGHPPDQEHRRRPLGQGPAR